MPAGYRFDIPANDVAAFVLGKCTWAVLALTCHIELFSQAHYRASIAARRAASRRSSRTCSSSTGRRSRSTPIIDELEWLREDAKLASDAERDAAVDDLIALVGGVDGILQVPGQADAAYFLRVAGLADGAQRARRSRRRVLKAYRWQYIVSGAIEPRFQKVLGRARQRGADGAHPGRARAADVRRAGARRRPDALSARPARLRFRGRAGRRRGSRRMAASRTAERASDEPAPTLLLAAAALLLPAAAQPRRRLRVVTDATFPPMEFGKDGKRTGFDIELIEALGAAMGRKIEWIDIDFKGLIPALVSKRADLAMSAIYITDERRKVVDFSDPYFAGGLVVLTTKAGPIKTLKDLDGKKVTVQVGTKSVGCLKDNYPKVERVEVEKNQEMFNLVEIGRADAAVTGKPAAKVFAQAKPALYVLAEQLTTEDYGIAVRKDAPELRDAVNAALKKIKADGTYDKLVQKWFEAGK